MDELRRDDIERARRTPPEVRLAQALAAMRFGIRLQRKKLRAKMPDAPEEQVRARLREWLLQDG